MGVVLSVRFRCVPNYDVTESIVPCATLEEALSGEDAFQLQQFYLVPHHWAYFAQRRAIVAYQEKRGIMAKLYRIWWYLNIDLIARHHQTTRFDPQKSKSIRFFIVTCLQR